MLQYTIATRLGASMCAMCSSGDAWMANVAVVHEALVACQQMANVAIVHEVLVACQQMANVAVVHEVLVACQQLGDSL